MITDKQRLDWMIKHNPVNMGFSWRLQKEGSSESHWICISYNNGESELFYGKDYIECIDKAIDSGV